MLLAASLQTGFGSSIEFFKHHLIVARVNWPVKNNHPVIRLQAELIDGLYLLRFRYMGVELDIWYATRFVTLVANIRS